MEPTKSIFPDFNPDDSEQLTTEVESLCMSCSSNGTTRLLLTKIPFYREVILMSFSCDKCGCRNNEIQSGADINDKGIQITLKIQTKEDLNRQVVKSDYTSFKIVELDFEIPSRSQKGEVTTIEGILNRSIEGLQQDQATRKVSHPEVATQIEEFINKLSRLKEMNNPFTIVLEDISGNSFIENPNAPQTDKNCITTYFTRTKEQDHTLGMYTHEEVTGETNSAILQPIAEDEFTYEDMQSEVMQFSTNCSNCGSPCKTHMKMTSIPHFKDVVIMATTCDACGHRTNEVKSGGGIEAKGVLFEIQVRNKDDFSRDVLKSETCSLEIPELELEVGPYALGGRFTTVEGLLVAVKDQLSNPERSHMFGDSQEPKAKARFSNFLEKFDGVLNGETAVTLILDDPAGNSYVQSLQDNNEPDEGLKIKHYNRTFEQNDELGINDMKTDNYETK